MLPMQDVGMLMVSAKAPMSASHLVHFLITFCCLADQTAVG